MSTRGVADVVFCIDASASMQPCINNVIAHVSDFVEGLQSGNYASWDLRMDFVAHSAASTEFRQMQQQLRQIEDAGVPLPSEVQKLKSIMQGRVGDLGCRQMSVHHADCHGPLYKTAQGSGFFTANVSEFTNALGRVRVEGDEAAFIGLDIGLDFPWRQTNQCHRVVVMLTDEPLEGGVAVDRQMAQLPAIIDKIHRLGVMLFLVAPESPGFDELSAADRSEWEVVASIDDGLGTIDFRKVLGYIGKSISKSLVQAASTKDVPRGLFGQATWE